MVTIQSADVNSYIKSLVENVMEDRFQGNETSNPTSRGEEDSQSKRNEKTHKGWCTLHNRRM